MGKKFSLQPTHMTGLEHQRLLVTVLSTSLGADRTFMESPVLL